MKVLELMCSLEEAYDRFGDIEVKINLDRQQTYHNTAGGPPIKIVDFASVKLYPKELIIESEEFIIKCE